MSLLRSRIKDFCNRISRDDMLTLFSSHVSFKNFQVNVILQNAQVISPHIKYQAACILEIATGQRPTLDEIDVEDELLVDAESLKTPEMVRQLIFQAGRSLTPDEMKMITDTKGIRLRSDLNQVNMVGFLEKIREFYLPDLAAVNHAARKAALETNIHEYFKKISSKRSCKRPRERIVEGENPSVASAAYLLKSADLLKFPDIELYFEPLHNVLGGGGGGSKENDYLTTNSLQLYIRPTVEVKDAFGEKFFDHFSQRGPIDNLKVMNYFLSLFFNPYATRSSN